MGLMQVGGANNWASKVPYLAPLKIETYFSNPLATIFFFILQN
jgi:hypothetical protein